MASTFDADLFKLIEENDREDVMTEIISKSLSIKKSIVEQDEKESGIRRVLNFGHTIGHGIESCSNGTLYHGECVALGMLPMCGDRLRARLLPILAGLGLPTDCALPMDAVLDAMMHDKKAKGGGIQSVLSDEVGDFRFETLTREALAERIARAFPNMK